MTRPAAVFRGLHSLRRADTVGAIGAVLGIVATVALRLNTTLHADVAHFLALSKITSGTRQLYDDVIDQNTPGIVSLERLSVSLSAAAGVPLDRAHTIVVTLVVGVAFLLGWRAVRRLVAQDSILLPAFGLCGALTFFALPGNLFGSREHLFFVCFVPYVACLVAPQAGLARSAAESVAIGLLAAFGVFLKPHFLLFAVVATGYELWQARFRLGHLSRETWIAGFTLVAAYAAFLVLEPAYLGMVIPFTLATFTHYQIGFWPAIGQQLPVLRAVAGVLVVAALLARLVPAARLRQLLPLGWLFWAAGVLVVGVQGFGFAYHSLPLRLMGYLGGALLCVWGASVLLHRDTAGRRRSPGTRTLIGGLVGGLSVIVGVRIAQEVYRQRQIPGRQEFVTHPFVRLLNDNGPEQYAYIVCSSVAPGGLAYVYSNTGWAGHMIPMFFLPVIGDRQRDPTLYPDVDAAALATVERSERRRITSDFESRRPRLVLIDVGRQKRYFKSADFDYLAFFTQDSAFAAVWRRLNYQPAGVVMDFYDRPFAVFRRSASE